MSPRVRQRARIALLAFFAGGLAAWLVPSYINTQRYRRGLQAGLERTLHRHVTFSRVSLQVLPRPGFVIENAAIQEDPAFGFEPFVRVDRIECDVRWQTLLGARLSFSRIRLEHPNINLVRRAGEGWNVERLFLVLTDADLTNGGPRNDRATAAGLGSGGPQSGGIGSAPSGAPAPPGPASAPLSSGLPDLEVEDGRVNFKLGDNKQALAITEMRAQLSFDQARSYLRFRLVGYPVRRDLPLPTPGAVEVSGEWKPGRDLRGPLDVVVRARDALVYDWAPLVTGHDTALYGVLDTELHVTGSSRNLEFQGTGRLSELHRWDQIPPSDPMPWSIIFRGRVDRERDRVLLEATEASFADSHVYLSGTIDYPSNARELNLALSLERSRIEDVAALLGRIWTLKAGFGIRGQIDGTLAVQGPWAEPRYTGLLAARNVVLATRSATFPVSDFAVNIDNRGARLDPVLVTLAPRVVLEAEGALERGAKTFPYELTLSCKTVPLRDVVSFGRALGMRTLERWNAEGSGTASFRFTGVLPPTSRPALKGRAELRAARLAIPGFTEPINVPRASIQVNGTQIIVDRLQAVLGTSVFSGRLEHQGDRHSPWIFDLHTDNLDLAQGASWFVALPHRNPGPLVRQFPRLASLAVEREVASNLFSSVNARGRFSASKLTYRNVCLDNFQTTAEITGRVIRLSSSVFQTRGAQGRSSGRLDLTGRPARLAADVSLSGVLLQSLAPHLPIALRGARGTMSVSGHFETTGLSQEEMWQNLQGRAEVIAKDLSLAGFDPVGTFVRLAGQGALEPLRGPAGFRTATLSFEVHDRRVVLKKTALNYSGARLILSGDRGFDGIVNLHVTADLQHLRRRWLSRADDPDPESSPPELDLSGPLENLAPTSRNQELEVGRAVTSDK
jgi:hypothetical protein